ncbi:MAG: DUF4974 domain-containing protein [Bacteroidales bacterium]|nr:DUF4974 domain-containing protein [Bacteroidales bacterium]
MLTEKQRIDYLLDLQENPERFTDQELQQLLEDNEMRLLIEQLAFAKRAFITQEAASSVDAEWDNFANKYADELSRLDQQHMKIAFTTLLRRIAAVVVGIVLLSGIAFATVHYINNYINNNHENCTETNPIDILQKQSIPTENNTEIPATKRIFDNVPLEEILAEIAVAYNAEVEFQDDSKRTLRLHFVWKSEDNLNRVVEKLNTFNVINITIKNNKLIVK